MQNVTGHSTTIELAKENFKFSSGHFTIFSAEDRENFHGHNFTAAVELDIMVSADGMSVDYGMAKCEIERLCSSLDEYFLLPERSPYLKVVRANGKVIAQFGDETLVFLERDVRILPLANVTVEELAKYFCHELHSIFCAQAGLPIVRIKVKIGSGPGQSGSREWKQTCKT
ncbi:MAG: 6-carboxytetrahydropterin synthase [Methylocystis sp.]